MNICIGYTQYWSLRKSLQNAVDSAIRQVKPVYIGKPEGFNQATRKQNRGFEYRIR